MSPTPFERLLPLRVLIAPRTLVAWAWGGVGAAALIVLLLVLALLADLWVHRGELVLSGDEIPEAAALLGLELPENVPAFVNWTNLGVGPTAWRLRATPAGQLLGWAVRQAPMLSVNRAASATLLLLLLSSGLFRIAARARVRRSADDFATRVASSLRSQLHRQALRLGPSDLDGARQDEALRLFTRDVDQIQDGVSDWLTRLGRDLPTLIALAILALAIDWRLFLICAVPLGCCWWVVDVERKQSDARRREAESKAASALRLLSDSLRKSRLVRGYGMETFEHERFQRHLEQFSIEAMSARRIGYWALRFVRVAIGGLVAMLLYFVGARVLAFDAPMSASGGFLLLATFAAATPSMGTLLRIGAARSGVDEAGNRVFQYINEIPEVGQAVGARFLEPLSRTIIYESVNYQRGDRELLRQFDLRLPSGKMTALVSLDPLQPRTAAYMLPRFIEPQGGRVLYDSEDIAWATLESLRAETVYVGGADPCFNGTVLENITCGESRYAVAEATEAAKLVHAHNFISRLPKGYETLLGERGHQLEAGQAFRLGLARAALRKPALVIVEEPDVSLDDDTKAMLDDAYQRIANGRTVIFLPSRLSTVRKCDLIVLLAEGKVAAMGTHAELLKSSELYRHWEYVSFNAFRKRPGT
ncbi:MAG: ABC transporter ATP-binding protein [Planctomyces sp.]|nr:ABC transporter ATP-binding protein [Planctomyces sp.]